MLFLDFKVIDKSYIAEQFAKAEYKSYILIDFGQAPTDVIDLFVNDSAGIYAISRFASPHVHNWSRTFISEIPLSVREYSTLGGI